MPGELQLRIEDKDKWKLENLHNEFIIGFSIVFFIFKDNFYPNFELVYLPTKLISEDSNNTNNTNNTNNNLFTSPTIINEKLFENRKLYEDIPDSEKKLFRVSSNVYGIWIDDTLYKFFDPIFFKGVLTAFNYFELDFRDYVYKVPFKTQLSKDTISFQNIYFKVPDYDIP